MCLCVSGWIFLFCFIARVSLYVPVLLPLCVCGGECACVCESVCMYDTQQYIKSAAPWMGA